MQILTDINNVVAFTGTIEKGIYDADKSRELYKITNDNGTFYAVTEFNLYEVDALPDGFEDMKYCYTEEDGFYKNPNQPGMSIEEKVAVLEEQNDELQDYIDIIMTEVIPSLMGMDD